MGTTNHGYLQYSSTLEIKHTEENNLVSIELYIVNPTPDCLLFVCPERCKNKNQKLAEREIYQMLILPIPNTKDPSTIWNAAANRTAS